MSHPTTFQPGESGNPNGRPSFREAIARVGAQIVERDNLKVTRTESCVIAAYELAEKGDTNAFRFLAQHSEGIKTQVENSGETTHKIVVEYVVPVKDDSPEIDE